jgi:hypothetical protein
MAWELQLVPATHPVAPQLLEVLRRQFKAAMRVAHPAAPAPLTSCTNSSATTPGGFPMNDDAPQARVQSLEITPAQAWAVFQLIDNVSLVRMIRDETLTPSDVRSLMDLWKILDHLAASDELVAPA